MFHNVGSLARYLFFRAAVEDKGQGERKIEDEQKVGNSGKKWNTVYLYLKLNRKLQALVQTAQAATRSSALALRQAATEGRKAVIAAARCKAVSGLLKRFIRLG